MNTAYCKNCFFFRKIRESINTPMGMTSAMTRKCVEGAERVDKNTPRRQISYREYDDYIQKNKNNDCPRHSPSNRFANDIIDSIGDVLKVIFS